MNMGTRKSSRTDIPLFKRKELTNKLKLIINERSSGIGIVGVASIDRFENSPKGHGPRDFISDANAVVVLGLPILDGVADYANYEMKDSEIVTDEDIYVGKDGIKRIYNPRLALQNQVNLRSAHEALNMEIQILSIYAGAFLENEGYKSLVMPTTYGTTFSWQMNVDKDYPRNVKGIGQFSHRHAAVAAGLGSFGLNNLLLTPNWGPRNRFTTIITRAPLIADELTNISSCLGEKCSKCVDSCCAKAFGDVFEFEAAGVKQKMAKFDHFKCEGAYGLCKRACISSCPVGSF